MCTKPVSLQEPALKALKVGAFAFVFPFLHCDDKLVWCNPYNNDIGSKYCVIWCNIRNVLYSCVCLCTSLRDAVVSVEALVSSFPIVAHCGR